MMRFIDLRGQVLWIPSDVKQKDDYVDQVWWSVKDFYTHSKNDDRLSRWMSLIPREFYTEEEWEELYKKK